MATYYWTGRSTSNQNYSNKDNWSTISNTGAAGSTYPSYDDDIIIDKSASILLGGYFCRSITIGTVNSSTPISVSIIGSGVTPRNTNNYLRVQGDFTIHPNAKDNLYLRFGSLYLFGPAVAGTQQKINTNGAVISCLEIRFNQYFGCQLLSDFVASWDTSVLHCCGRLDLNGYGLTAGAFNWNSSNITSTTNLTDRGITTSKESNPAVINFTARPGATSNLSYICVTGADNSTNQSYPFYYNYSPLYAPYQYLTFSGQRPMLVFSFDTNVRTQTASGNPLGVSRTIYGTAYSPNTSYAYNAADRPSTKTLLDFYFIDGTPSAGQSSTLPWSGPYTELKSRYCYHSLDFTGNTPGTNVPKGLGLPHLLVVPSVVNSDNVIAVMGNILLNYGQQIIGSSRSSANMIPQFYFWHVYDIADSYHASDIYTRQPLGGWNIDLQYNVIGSGSISGSLNINLTSKTEINILSPLVAYIVNVYATDETAFVWLVGVGGLYFSRSFNHYSGTISTLYSDGSTNKIASVVTSRTDLISSLANASLYYIGDYKGSIAYNLYGGRLDLYNNNDIVIVGAGYLSPSGQNYYYISYFQVQTNSKINFYFITGTGYSDNWKGIIQTDSFYVLSGITLRVNCWSDAGNLVTSAPILYPAIAVTGPGAYKSTVTGMFTPDVTTYPALYGTSVVWKEDFNSNVIVESIGQTPVLDTFQTSFGSLIYGTSLTSAGPLTVTVTRQDETVNPYFYWGAGTGNVSTKPDPRMIYSKSGNVFFKVTNDLSGTTDYLYFNSNSRDPNFYQPYIAGLDVSQASELKISFYDANYLSTPGATPFSGTGQLWIGNPEGGSVFDSIDNYVDYFPPYYNSTLQARGGSATFPAQIDVQQPLIKLPIYIDGTGAYYTISGNVYSSNTLYLGNDCTLDQSLNSLEIAPTFDSVNLDYGTGNATFIHGSPDYSTYNNKSFNINGFNKTVWSSQRSGLKIYAKNIQGIRLRPSVIAFTSAATSGSRYVYPGSIANYGELANDTYVYGTAGNPNPAGKNTPDQNALIFDFYDGQGSTVNSRDTIYIGNAAAPTTQTVQTILLGSYDYSGQWTGFSGSLIFQSDVVFVGNYSSPFEDSISQYYDDSSEIGGGLHQGLSSISSSYSLYFQGSGFIWLDSTRGTLSNVYVGSSKYQYYIQTNQPGLLQSYVGNSFNNYYYDFYYYGSLAIREQTSYYSIGGNYKNLYLHGGTVSFTLGIYTKINTGTAIVALTVQDTIGKTSKGGFTSVDLTNYDVNGVFGNDPLGSHIDIGDLYNSGVGGLVTYVSTSTSTQYFFASGSTALRFADGQTFNANLGTYTNISIGSYPRSGVKPNITIIPCGNTNGSPDPNIITQATFASLDGSGGPAIYNFAAGSTSTFQYFYYNDIRAPLDIANNWQGYSNTSSNTVLKSTVAGLPWYISIPTPHLGTFRSGNIVNNLSIQDSVALDSYIWFAPGTVNSYANTGTSFRPGYTNGSNDTYYPGVYLPYYNYDLGRNSGWVFHDFPGPNMDLVFWDSPPFEWSSSTNHSHVTQSWSSTNYTTPGSFIWVAPSNVYSVSVTAIGGGGGGTSFGNPTNTGGAGGSVAWRANIPVQPNQSYVVRVGAGGNPNNPGGSSYFINSSTVYAPGGGVGAYGGNGAIVAGGVPIGIPVGDGFGLGQTGSGGVQYTGQSYLAGGGGAAGDYSAVTGNVYGSTMLYPVTYYPAWSNFMNSYAVWVNPDSVNPLNSAVRITRIITVPISQSYTFEIQADNSIDLYIDDTVTKVVRHSGFTNSTNYSQLLSAGQHTIIMDVTNAVGPGGFAILITGEDGVQYWNTRSMLNPSGGAANGVTSTTSTVSLQGGGGADILGLVNPIGSAATSRNGGLYGGGGSGRDFFGFTGFGAGGAVRISWPGFSAPK